MFWVTTKWAGLSSLFVVPLMLLSFLVFDHYSPPVLPAQKDVSAEVVDVDGKLLRAFATKQGRWRLAVKLGQVDSEYLKLLLAYEDKRFWDHKGVDPMALTRAFGQFITSGRIVSGGSTITMQLARLLEPRKRRSIQFKILQIVRALQLERRLGKIEILEAYLTLAPYGGNIEGIRAASFVYFGKEPRDLTLEQSALLVALPQAPERRRPDRQHTRAKKARDTVLKRMASLGVIAKGEVERAEHYSVPKLRLPMPHFAAHLAERLIRENPKAKRTKATLKYTIQRSLEQVAREAVKKLDKKTSLALILVDTKTGHVLAEIGSPDYLDQERSGWVDMTRAIRSPGSTLKPFIYGLAIDEGIVLPETIISDRPSDFYGYRPENFDQAYQGDVTIRRALQLSLNVPAVQLLEAVGPARLFARFKRSNIHPIIPKNERPGLAIGLGGIGLTLYDLVGLYTGLVNNGKVVRLRTRLGEEGRKANQNNGVVTSNQLLQPNSAWMITDILAGALPPKGVRRSSIAYKTGTSYGYRDAWAIGFDGRYALGVWVGRADNGSVTGITGYKTAAPILFEAFARSGLNRVPFSTAPDSAAIFLQSELPITLKRFRPANHTAMNYRVAELPPSIVYPPNGARVEMEETMAGEPIPLVLKMQNGRPPFRWLANGRLLPSGSRKRTAMWFPDGSGFSTLTVIDAVGRAASVDLYLRAHE